MHKELTTARSTPDETLTWRQMLPDQTSLQDAIHQPHQKQRDRLLEVLVTAADPTLQKHAHAMATCASSVHLYFDPDMATAREYIHTCKARLCPFCGRRRSNHVAHQMQKLVDTWKEPRHIVLTVKSRPQPLRQQIADLVKWFAKLRRDKFWQQHVSAGTYTIETTINERTGLWHPHLHIIADGTYMPFKALQYRWHTITGGSEIIWIENAHNRQGMVRELCKYIGKPQHLKHWTDANIIEYALAVKSTRMVQTFGKKHPQEIEDKTPDKPRSQAEDSVSLARLIWQANHGNDAATRALPLIAARWPHLGRFIYAKMPQLQPDDDRAARTLRIMAIIDAGTAPPRELEHAAKDCAQLEAEICPLLAMSLLAPVEMEDPWQQYA